MRQIGAGGVAVSEVGFGAWVLGLNWWGEVDELKAQRLVGAALDSGITFFDTADVYGEGRSEELLGSALSGCRDKVAIGSKFGYVISGSREHSQGERPHDWRPEAVRASLENSLRRLGTDWIDLYELHNPRMDAILRDDLFASLEDLRGEGKVRAIGVALGPAIGWEAEGVEAIEGRKVDAVQTVFNLLEQDPGRALAAAAARTGTSSLIARVPHASDVLSEEVDENTEFSAGDHRSHRKRAEIADLVAKKRAVEFLKDSGRTMGQAALAFVLANPVFASALVTTVDEDRIAEYAEASSLPLTGEELARVEELRSANFGVQSGYTAVLKS
ncbi:MAG: aldo/keto reductase [Acidobacteria bacterium]|nr:MAG: aldo/keto reductase [Acidobacteriota bacterium]